MNIAKRLRHLSEKLDGNRAYGKTTMLAKAAQELGAILLVASTGEATHLQRKFRGLTSKTFEINLEGFTGPFMIDNHAASVMFLKAADKIDALELEVQQLREKLGLPTNIKEKDAKESGSLQNIFFEEETKTKKKKSFGWEFGDY